MCMSAPAAKGAHDAPRWYTRNRVMEHPGLAIGWDRPGAHFLTLLSAEWCQKPLKSLGRPRHTDGHIRARCQRAPSMTDRTPKRCVLSYG
eukprot:gene25815-biopygen7520